ncbi:MAG: SNF2-related protein [bacterium]
MQTAYHAKYYAHKISKVSSSSSIDKLAMSLFDACVDLNPHQVEASLFAFRSPLSKGVILADEVGLGKTIEAGLILCQYWTERKRNLLVICPASLRKQWSLELTEKFNIPNIILEAKNYNQFIKNKNSNPFNQNKIVIVSYNFANTKKSDIRFYKWDLAVIDEAHKLRNVYKKNNKIGNGIKFALEDTKKILLTATPLQNSLMELYGLSIIINDHIFGDDKSFRTQYVNNATNFEDLRYRLSAFCKRTLRKDVLEYIKYTQRKAITRRFEANDLEQELYFKLSAFLQREDTFAIPKSQRTLTTLVLRKLLASSSHAIIGTLETIKTRLESIKNDFSSEQLKLNLCLDEDMQELIDEEEDEIAELELEDEPVETEIEKYNKDKIKKIEAEIAEIQEFIDLAKKITIDSKTQNLIAAIEVGFKEMEKMGASRKAIIFTESRRTQEYLKKFLDNNGFKDKTILFNGTNSSKEANQIYKNWLEKNKDTGKISESKTADKRNALIEHFRDNAEILIATESAAEGINLQFCSLVINYDLPWNPQRIEQRIGRCHRYGQKYDVVVINFLNIRNEADCRVHILLEEKFNLFNGIFGASDEVLGSIESGVDFEKRILSIYQDCRSTEQIEQAFNELQKEMDEKIQTKMDVAKKNILEHFDEDVHTRLKIQLDETKKNLNQLQWMFWQTSKAILKNYADFNDNDCSFVLYKRPVGTVLQGKYHLISKDKENIQGEYLYRLSNPLGEYVIDKAKELNTQHAELVFDITNHPTKISIIENLKGKSGYLILNKLSINSFDFSEHLIFNAYTDDGEQLDQELCQKLFSLKAKAQVLNTMPKNEIQKLKEDADCHVQAIIGKCREENNVYFIEESERLDKWADDMIKSSEKELDDTKRLLRELRKNERQAKNINNKLDLQKQIREIENKQSRLRRDIFNVEDEIKAKRDKFIAELEQQMQEKTEVNTLFMVRFQIV